MILSHLNEIEAKFKQHYKEKRSIFFIALKLNNRYFDQKDIFKMRLYLNHVFNLIVHMKFKLIIGTTD